jgi:multidrug resistance efflux pump
MSAPIREKVKPSEPTENHSPHDVGMETRELISKGYSVQYQRDSASFYSLKLLYQSQSARIIGIWLFGIFVLMIGFLFLPWQQNIRADGVVTGLKPQERPQVVNTTIGGRILEWYVQEGQYVKQGDPLVKLAEIKDKYLDPQTAQRIQEQVQGKEQVIRYTREKYNALGDQLVALRQGLALSLDKARNKVDQGRFKVTSDSAALVAARIDYDIALQQVRRYEQLYRDGLISLTQIEARRIKVQETQAKLTSAENKLAGSQNELINAQIELGSLRAEYNDKIAKTEGDRASTLAYINDTEASVAKLRNELSNVTQRNEFYTVRAPQSGYVVKALKAGYGEIIKASDPLVTIMPNNTTLAVELYVKANDVPLLSRGRKVRLQFDGWPALQFSGWPSVSVGTFGGEVAVIDYVNTGNNKYRILVTHDKADEPWPPQLRVGSGVYGWAMLDEVPIWFEIWRQLNGFPPSLKTKPDDYDALMSKGAKGDKGGEETEEE